jgi:hypothetical protein
MTVIDASRPPRPDVPPPADVPPRADAPLPPQTVGGERGAAGPRSTGAALPRVGVVGGEGDAGVWRWARWVALAVGGFLLPWCVVLAMTLPHTAHAQNWSLAWVGLDAAEAIAALATAVLLARGDARASLTAAAGGVLLTIDAWFDVCTSAPGLDRALALAEASCAELPLATAAFWLALTLTRRVPAR